MARRWTREGRDRLYVTTLDGERVGWVDMVTGQATLQRSTLAVEFGRAVRQWRGEHGEIAKVIPALSINMDPHERPDVEAAVPRLPRAVTPSEQHQRAAAESRAFAPLRRNSVTQRIARFLVGGPAAS
jgi:hypothetical protein